MEKAIPRWWKLLKELTILGFAIWPFLFFMSLFMFDSGENYHLKVYIVCIVDSYPLWIFPLNYLALLIYRLSKSHIVGLCTYLIPIILIWGGCVYYNHGTLPAYMYHTDDHRLFWNTPVSGLAEAIIIEDTAMIHKILAQEPELAHYSDSHHGQSMLFYAFDRGSFASVRQLIRMGAEVNECSKIDGESLLHRLCGGIHEEIKEKNFVTYKTTMPQSYLDLMKWLLDYGADTNLPAEDGEHAFCIGHTPIQCLCLHGPDSPQAIDLLIQYGAKTDVRRKNYENKYISPLADAIYFRNYKVATELVQSGAKPDSMAKEYLEWNKDRDKECYDLAKLLE